MPQVVRVKARRCLESYGDGDAVVVLCGTPGSAHFVQVPKYQDQSLQCTVYWDAVLLNADADPTCQPWAASWEQTVYVKDLEFAGIVEEG